MNTDPERKKATQRLRVPEEPPYDADKDFDRLVHGSLAALLIMAGTIAIVLWGCQ